jgi:hypothetical protein
MKIPIKSLVLFHGTTWIRAMKILNEGPRLNIAERFGVPKADCFSAALIDAADDQLGNPMTYARCKSENPDFRNEGGPFLVWFAAPLPMLRQMAKIDYMFEAIASSGEFQFAGASHRFLSQEWHRLEKGISKVEEK